MSFSRGSTLINPPQPSPNAPPKSRTGLIIGIIILVIIVIALIVLVIIFFLRSRSTSTDECTTNANCTGGKLCSNGKCVVCISPPAKPESVNIVYDSEVGSATVSWVASAGANYYNVYRKLEDPSVGVNNYTSKDEINGLSKSFTTLPEGTHYFVVTAVNDCGESPLSSPVVFAPSCGTIPSTMMAPVVTQDSNECGNTANADIVDISFTDESIDNGVYIVQGTGQVGDVPSYLYFVQGSAHGPALGVHLKCGGETTSHTVMQITEAYNAEITVDAPPTTVGTSFEMTWKPIAGMEMYAVFIVGVDDDGVPHFTGGFAGGNQTSLTVATNDGDTPVFGMVLGARLCSASKMSAATEYITDSAPP